VKSLNYIKAIHTVGLEIPGSPAIVFNHLIDLSKWWPEDFLGEELRPETEFILKTGDGHFSKNKVIEFVPGKKLVWLTSESLRTKDGYDWSGTKFIFELNPKGDGTDLIFTYDGVVLDIESDRLKQVCDLCIKRMFYEFVMNGKTKENIEEQKTAGQDFTTSIEVISSPQEIFGRITKDVSKWWGGKDFSGNSVCLGDEFIINHPEAHYSKQRLVEVIPGKKLVWLVLESDLNWLKDRQEWTNTRMIFEIIEKPHSFLLRFIHAGLIPEKECYEKCTQGWTMVIKDWLYNLIMYGREHF